MNISEAREWFIRESTNYIYFQLSLDVFLAMLLDRGMLGRALLSTGMLGTRSVREYHDHCWYPCLGISPLFVDMISGVL